MPLMKKEYSVARPASLPCEERSCAAIFAFLGWKHKDQLSRLFVEEAAHYLDAGRKVGLRGSETLWPSARAAYELLGSVAQALNWCGGFPHPNLDRAHLRQAEGLIHSSRG